MPLLDVNKLHFGYTGRNLFQDFNLSIEPGLTWIQGLNGSGKSTLLRILGGATPCSIGTITCGALKLSEQPLAYRQLVYWMGPDAPAFDHLTATQFWQFLAGLYPLFELPLTESLSEALGFSPFSETPIRVLSSGNQRKAGLIAALSVGCPVVLLDEPFNALDNAAQQVLISQLTEHARDELRAWVITSHTIAPRLNDIAKTVLLKA
jgi:ABC-type multidrug transport system ATPase subunit